MKIGEQEIIAFEKDIDEELGAEFEFSCIW